ncbi:hypothetical protein UR09_04720 [Candidatus Nitromaritima sp. SCGC AAA799-A02]|nr:hypothetical protein UR09_04720 [Candidatus Nitromaritima sp. SCGC AAA799-A02]KMP12452.1 hypothetical protein UZ36_00925 [Candidatus Nitromaritima sp. SCGC AAA799-C22]
MLPEWILLKKQIEESKPDLQGADLGYAKLMEIDLAEADLTDADLSAAYLIRANLGKANLTDADLSGAVVSEANLKGADLKGANLEDTYLHGADLTGAANLTCDQIELAHFDKETRFPDYIQIIWTSEKHCTCNEK